MRLYLLPISTRRTLIYCKRLDITPPEQQSWIDKGTARATKLWAGWEKKESGWQSKVVHYGNRALKRIPYEEWGLKSIPPLSARRREDELSGKEIVEVAFPKTLIPEGKITSLLRTLATERQSLHKTRMIWSFVGMPISAPAALVPVVPNLPFFYLVFRAWSHWRALSGSKHLEFLLNNDLIKPQPSEILENIYSTRYKPPGPDSEGGTEWSSASSSAGPTETLVLQISDGKRIAEALEVPELNVELERAVFQVQKSLDAEKTRKEEKAELDSALPKTKEKT